MERDCLVCVLEKVSLEDLTLGVPFVCRSWRGASLDPLCWRVLDFRELDFMPWRNFARRVAARYPLSPFLFSSFLAFALRRSRGLAHELRFPTFSQVSIHDLLAVSNECPRLKTLVLSSLRLEDHVRIPELIGKWKELEHLEMESNPSTFPSIAAAIGLNCRRFRGLKMAGLRVEDARAIADHLPGLKYLNLSDSFMAKETLLMLMDACGEVEVLIVERCIGFEGRDEEVLAAAARVGVFEHGGSKLTYDSDDA